MSIPAGSKGVCRACLLDSSEKLKLLGDEDVDIYAFCTSVQLNECNSLPKAMCIPCFEQLNNFYSFKQKCIQSNQTLIQNVEAAYASSVKVEIVPIDAEVKLEDDIDIDHYEGNSADEFDGDVKYEDTESNASSDYIPGHKKNKNLTKKNKVKDKICKPKKASIKTHKCPICNSTFVYKDRLEIHILKHQGIIKKLECKECDAQFVTVFGLNSHVDTKHRVFEPSNCSLCGKTMKNPVRLREHLRKHKEKGKKVEKKYICEICGKGFRDNACLRKHSEIHQENRRRDLPCKVCGKYFINKGGLNQHMRIHTGDRRYPCTVCGFKCYSSTQLKRHMNTHDPVKKFQCTICHKFYSTSAFLKEHYMVHSGEKPFGCEFCPMFFVSKVRLVEHIRAHIGDKRYKCEICNHAFVQPGTYKRHLKVHGKLEVTKSNTSKAQILNIMNPEKNLRDCGISMINSTS